MARKPSYDFERRERAKEKATKRTEKDKIKAERKTIDEEVKSSEASSGLFEPNVGE